MDHRYIDENSVAERYLERELPADIHDAFESHLVDCEECGDRLRLAQIFLEHKPRQKPVEFDKESALAMLPMRARFVARMNPWLLLLIALLAAAALLAIPTAYFFVELTRVNRAR